MHRFIFTYLVLQFSVVLASEVTTFDTVKPVVGTKIPEFFLGAGTEFLYSINTKAADLNHPARLELIKDLKLQHLRGPAGTIANYYLWEKGYMFNPEHPDYTKYYKKIHMVGKGPGERPVTLPEIYKEAVACNIPYVFDVNVETQSPESIAKLVGEIKKLSSRPIFLEMGNELFEPGDSEVFRNCQEYISKVREISKAVKAVDPEAKIGVVCPAYPISEKKLTRSALRKLRGTGNAPVDRYLEWDKVLAGNRDAFDAVILHPYIFFKAENSTPESLMAFMFAWNAADEDVINVDYRALFPDKPIWVTEYNVLTWGVFKEKNKEVQNRLQVMKTPGAAIANMDTVLRFIDTGLVTLTSLHTFIDGQGFGIAQMSWDKDRTLVKLPNYFVFKALGEILANHPYYYKVRAQDNAGSTDMLLSYQHVSQEDEAGWISFQDVGAWGFGDKDGVKIIVLCNRTPYEKEAAFSGCELQKYWTYGGRQPFPNFLKNKKDWTAPPLEANNPPPEWLNTPFSKVLVLKPFSMTIARIAK